VKDSVSNPAQFIVPTDVVHLKKAKNIVFMNLDNLNINRLKAYGLERQNESIGAGQNRTFPCKSHGGLHLLEHDISTNRLFESLTQRVANARGNSEGATSVLPRGRIHADFILMHGKIEIGQTFDLNQSPKILILTNRVGKLKKNVLCRCMHNTPMC